MGDLLDAIKDTILGFQYVVGFGGEGHLLLRLGLILMVAIPFGLFLMSMLTLASNRLDKPTPTKQQQIETLRKAANNIGSRVERTFLGKTKTYRQFERLVKMADSPLGLNAREWFLLLVGTGLVVSIMVMMQSVIDWMIYKIYSIPLFSLFFYPTGAMAILYFYINSKAKKRSYILQYDFIRAFNRLGDLHNETSYRMLEVSLAGTRLLKNYLPRVDLFKKDPKEAMERFVNEIGMEEAILFKNTILNIINNPENKDNQILRAEMGIQKKRSADEQKGVKMLEMGFNTFAFGPFAVCVGAIFLPWYQFLKQQLSNLIGW